jgi:hypothetical protein
MPGQDHDPPNCASPHSWDDRHCHDIQPLTEMRSWSFCSGWPQTTIILISASQVASIIGLSRSALLSLFYFFPLCSPTGFKCGYFSVCVCVCVCCYWGQGLTLARQVCYHDPPFFLCYLCRWDNSACLHACFLLV